MNIFLKDNMDFSRVYKKQKETQKRKKKTKAEKIHKRD